jgi:hypothetical protein
LSNFATDEELLCAEDVDEQVWGGPEPGPGPGTSPQALSSEPPTSVAEADRDPAPAVAAVATPAAVAAIEPAAPATVAEASMLHLSRRRVLQLQSTAQKLWIALGISVAVNVVLASVLLFPGGGVPGPAGRTAGPEPSTAARTLPSAGSSSTAETVADPANGDDAGSTEARHEGPVGPVVPVGLDGPDASAPDSLAAVDESDAEELATAPYVALLSAAHDLLDAARDETRELAERIADYEAALVRLNDVRLNAPPSQRPTDIAEQIEQAERELERLRLREFFP